MANYDSQQLAMTGGTDPAYPRLGSQAFAVGSALSSTRLDTTDGTIVAALLGAALGSVEARMDATGGPGVASLVACLKASAFARLDATGSLLVGRFIPLSAVYRSADRITLAGLAVDLGGAPLRSVQLQFIGETVQQHFFGSSTDSNGIYVAYLEVGDSYAAYAYSAATGLVWRLEKENPEPNTTTLVFRRLTKRGGYGEGIFLGG